MLIRWAVPMKMVVPARGSSRRRPLQAMFVDVFVGDGLPDVPVCEANNHRRWFRMAPACRQPLSQPLADSSPCTREPLVQCKHEIPIVAKRHHNCQLSTVHCPLKKLPAPGGQGLAALRTLFGVASHPKPPLRKGRCRAAARRRGRLQALPIRTAAAYRQPLSHG